MHFPRLGLQEIGDIGGLIHHGCRIQLEVPIFVRVRRGIISKLTRAEMTLFVKLRGAFLVFHTVPVREACFKV